MFFNGEPRDVGQATHQSLWPNHQRRRHLRHRRGGHHHRACCCEAAIRPDRRACSMPVCRGSNRIRLPRLSVPRPSGEEPAGEVMRSINHSEMQLLFVDPRPEGRRRMSALMRITDSSRTSTEVRKVPKPEVASSLRRHWHGKKTAGFQTNVPVHPGARRSRRGRRGPP